MADELDARLRSLEAERLRLVPEREEVRQRRLLRDSARFHGPDLAAAAEDLLERLRRDFPQWHPDDESEDG